MKETRIESMKSAAGRFMGHAENILKYGSDGCSGVPDFNILYCCEKHDTDYRSGMVSRAAADRDLRECIRRRGWRFLPWIYWAGVRALGWRFYRYDRRRVYLTSLERSEIAKSDKNG